VAILKTLRGLSHVYDGDCALVDIAEDEVRSTALGSSAEVTTWRELEVELVDADERLLAKVGKRLVAAGASPAKSSSKLARTFGSAGVSAPDTATAVGLISAYLTEQLIQLGSGDVALRRGLDSVHKTRVAARRIRSVLRVFGSAFTDPQAARHLDEELSWYQDLLGEVRDRQVLRTRFDEAVHALPAELVLGPVAAKIDEALEAERVVALQAVATALDSDRYLTLMRDVDEWSRTPPVRTAVDTDDLLAMADRTRRKARKRLKNALASGTPERLHRARKAAKRARYATELTVPLLGKRAKKIVKAHKHVQDALGEHQDSVVATQVLLRLGGAAAQPGQNGFTYGLLYQRERTLAAQARRAARHLQL
jgi:CHAD domain-containing protein